MNYEIKISDSQGVTLRLLDDKLLPSIPKAERYIIDLSKLRYIRLVDAVNLLLLIGYLENKSGKKPLLNPPEDIKIASFLTNMRFFILAESHSLITRDVNDLEIGDVEKALPISHIPKALSSKDFQNWITKLTRTQKYYINTQLANIAKGKIAPLASVFVELSQNVHEHSKSYGYIAAQVEPSVKRPQRVHIAIGDLGVGIFESLSPFYESNRKRFERAFGPVWDEMKAIDIAFAPGVSSKARQSYRNFNYDEERGVGLWSILREVKKSKGAIICRTGRSKLFMGYYRGRWRTQRKTELEFFPGTQLDVQIPFEGK